MNHKTTFFGTHFKFFKDNSTGTHSIYHNFHDMEIMFHVATLLPSYPNDKQQLERKRHLGNDVVIIIFKEATSKFSPTMLKSEFNHIFVVVSEAGPNHYRSVFKTLVLYIILKYKISFFFFKK